MDKLGRVAVGQCKVGKPLLGKLRPMPHSSAGKSPNSVAGERRKRSMQRDRPCLLVCQASWSSEEWKFQSPSDLNTRLL